MMMGRLIRRAALLASVGVLTGSGVALGWEGNGNNNGWDNKNVRGCPDGYTVARAAGATLLTDLNGDGYVCVKISGNSGQNSIDNISNH
jgi:hypothetical protein